MRLIPIKKILKSNNVYCADCLKAMNFIPFESIDLVVTSPPYDDLRKYKGYRFDFKALAKELFRVIKPGGVVVWVVGDATIKGSETGTSFEQALYFKKIGFNLHDTMIYRKKNYMPLTHNRYDPAFEYMFVFSKGKPKTFNPLKVRTKTAGNKYNYRTRSSASTKEKKGALRSRDETKVTKDKKYRSNVWSYAIGRNKGSKDNFIFEHPATFPEGLAEDHILSWSNDLDIVLDPLCGSGTVLKMAKLLNRNFIGIDCSKKYCKITCRRIGLKNFKRISR